MGRADLSDKNVRKLQRTGENGQSYMVTLPKELIAELGWQKKQKVVVTRRGKELIIKDGSSVSGSCLLNARIG